MRRAAGIGGHIVVRDLGSEDGPACAHAQASRGRVRRRALFLGDQRPLDVDRFHGSQDPEPRLIRLVDRAAGDLETVELRRRVNVQHAIKPVGVNDRPFAFRRLDRRLAANVEVARLRLVLVDARNREAVEPARPQDDGVLAFVLIRRDDRLTHRAIVLGAAVQRHVRAGVHLEVVGFRTRRREERDGRRREDGFRNEAPAHRLMVADRAA